jgi:hypothetical protein
MCVLCHYKQSHSIPQRHHLNTMQYFYVNLRGVISQQIVIGLLQIVDPVPDILFLIYVDSRHHMLHN